MDAEKLNSLLAETSQTELRRRELLKKAEALIEEGQLIIYEFTSLFGALMPDTSSGHTEDDDIRDDRLMIVLREAQDPELGSGKVTATILPMDRSAGIHRLRRSATGTADIKDAKGIFISFDFIPDSNKEGKYNITEEVFLDGQEEDNTVGGATMRVIGPWEPPREGLVISLEDYVERMEEALGHRPPRGSLTPGETKRTAATNTLAIISKAVLDPDLNLELSHRVRKSPQSLATLREFEKRVDVIV